MTAGTTAGELADLLTAELKSFGDRKLLRCHKDVADLLGTMFPAPRPEPLTPAYWCGLGNVGALIGINFVIDETCAPGEWRLVRAADDSVVQSGVIR